MTLEEKKIVLVAGNYMSYATDEGVLNGYKTLLNMEEEHADEFASDYVSMWGPLGTISVGYTLLIIRAGIFNLEEFLEEYKKEMV